MRTHLFLILFFCKILSGFAQEEWHKVPSFPAQFIPVDFALTSDKIYLICHLSNPSQPKLLSSSDNGNTWTEVTMSGLPASDPVDIHYVNNRLFLVLSNQTVWYSLDFGLTWNSPSNAPPADVLYKAFTSTSNGNIFLIGNKNTTPQLYKSSDAGDSWTAVTMTGIGIVKNANSLFHAGGTLFFTWANAPFKGLYKSTDGGLNWTGTGAGLSDNNWFYTGNKFTEANPGELYITGCEFYSSQELRIYKSTNKGENWSAINHSGMMETLCGIAFIKTNGPFLLGGVSNDEGVLYTTASPVGFAESTAAESLSVYPIPATEHVTIKIIPGMEIITYEVTDMLGRIVMSQPGINPVINLEGIETGAYFIRALISDGSLQQCRFLKQ